MGAGGRHPPSPSASLFSSFFPSSPHHINSPITIVMPTPNGPSSTLRSQQDDVGGSGIINGAGMPSPAPQRTGAAAAFEAYARSLNAHSQSHANRPHQHPAGHASSRPTLSSNSASPTLPAPALHQRSSSAADSHSPSRRSTTRDDWTKTEDDCLLRCVRGYGVQQWDKALAAFLKASNRPQRSGSAVFARYKQLVSNHKAKRQALSKKLMAGSTRWAFWDVEWYRKCSEACSQQRSNPRSMASSSSTTGPQSSHSGRFGTVPDNHGEDELDQEVNASDTPTVATSSRTSLPRTSNAVLAHSILPPVGQSGSGWTRHEDEILVNSVERHDRLWDLVESDFRAAFPQHSRSRHALVARYHHLHRAARERQEAEGGTSPSPSSAPQQQAGSATMPRSSEAEPRAPDVPTAQNQAWTEEEEADLLGIVLQHPELRYTPGQGQDQGFSCDSFEAAYAEYSALYPERTKTLTSVQTKSLELLQRHFDEQEHEEHEERGGGTAKRGEGAGHGQDEGVDLLMDEPDAAASEGVALNNEHQADHQGIRAASQSASSGAQSANEQHRDGSAAHSTLPAQGTTTSCQAPLASNPIIDHDVHILENGFRFQSLPSNTEIRIYSSKRYHITQPASGEILPGSAAGAAPLIFNILHDGSLLELVTPPGTRTQVVFVNEDGESVASGPSGAAGPVVGVETHFMTQDLLRIVFWRPL